MSAQALLEQIESLAPQEKYWLYEALALHLQTQPSPVLRVLNKWANIVAYFEPDHLSHLTEIINKVQFTNSAWEIDWRIGMGINLEEELQVNFTIKLNLVQETAENLEKKQTIMLFFAKLLEKLLPDDLADVEKALDNILGNMQKPYQLDLGMMPLLFLDQETAVLICRIKGKILPTLSH